jgi:hypothetical protein
VNEPVATDSQAETGLRVPPDIPFRHFASESLRHIALWLTFRLRVCNPLPPRISSEIPLRVSAVCPLIATA